MFIFPKEDKMQIITKKIYFLFWGTRQGFDLAPMYFHHG